MKAVSAFAGFALALILMPAWAFALPPVWTVRDQDSTIVIFGSVHLLPEGLNWRPPALADALAHADDVWFEVPMDAAGQSAALEAALAHGFLPKGQTLSALLSSRGRERLARAAKQIGFPEAQLDRLQPWYAEAVISAGLFKSLGAERSQGVEEQLWAGVSDTAKRQAFETPQQQIGFFADAPMKDQLASLEQALKDAADAEEDYRTLLKDWMSGDLKALDREVVRPLHKSSPALYDTLVVQRNARWTDAIAARLAGSGHTVIIVGMGHLIGPDGVPARLRARGFDVEGPR